MDSFISASGMLFNFLQTFVAFIIVINFFRLLKHSVLYKKFINVKAIVSVLLWCVGVGIGTGVGSALFADISRVTSTEQRTAVMSVFMAIRQIGLLLGKHHLQSYA